MASAAARSWWDDDNDDREILRDTASRNAERRFARVSNDETRTGERTLSRAHAAGFASAFDIDGAFGGPVRRGRDAEYADDGSRVIVLERRPEPETRVDTSDFAAVDTGSFITGDAVQDTDDFAALDTGSFAAIGPVAEGRRTVRIAGRPEDRVQPRRLREIEPRRQRRTAVDRAASRPDRIALYAVLLGLFLVVLAAASAHG